jgi:hypothetical protein
MSDRVTWESCPSCGRTAAVGWTPIQRAPGEPFLAVPTELDCLSGCHLTEHDLTTAFPSRLVMT